MRIPNRCLAFTLAMIFTAAGASAVPVSAGTAEFTVSRTDDPTPNGCLPGDCSLREAIIAGNSAVGAVIHVPGGMYRLSRGGQLENGAMTGDLDITAGMTISGAGPSATIVDAKGIDRVFQVTSGDVAISGLKITGGAIELNDGEASSGGLLNLGNTTLSNVAISDNTTWGDGGGIDNGGTLTISDSVISGNTSNSAAGGIENGGSLTIERSRIESNEAFVAGGIDHFAGTLTLTDSTVSSNYASGAFGGGGGIQNGGNAVLVITGSTIADNSAKSDGAGLKSRDNSTATITNSTFSGNDSSGEGGGIAVFDGASVHLTNATIADNHSDDAGGGVFNDESGQQMTLKNVILHGNSSPGGDECNGGVSSLGHNVFGPIDGCILLDGVPFGAGPGAEGDVFGDPMLGPLQDNGGPTATYAIANDSPAFDAGAGDGCPATDQRGVERPQGAACDIGAFELEVEPDNGMFGDVDCDNDVDSVDSLKILRHVAGLSVQQADGCPEIESGTPLFGDVGCDEDIDAVDALFILRYVAQLPVVQPQGCPEIGT